MGQIAEVVGASGPATLDDLASAEEHAATRPWTRVVPPPRGPADGMRLVVSRGPDTGAEFAISAPLTVIGRHRDSDVVVDDVTASRYHAELEVIDGRCVLFDGGSLNGTYVNRKPVTCVELADGDEIWIGTARFLFRAA